MPSYKLTYVDSRGRAEISRLLFHAAGVPFEDVRLTREEVEARRPNLPFGHFPTLEIDGQVFSLSLNIATYLAKQFGFNGKTEFEELRVGEVIHHLAEIIGMASQPFEETDEAIRAKILKRISEDKLPKAMGYLDKLLEKNGTGYFVGSEMTLADIAVYDFCTLLETFGLMKISEGPSELQKLATKVTTHPKLANYISERK